MSDPELLSAERLKNLVKLTGVIDVDAVKNLQGMIAREAKKDTSFNMPSIEVYDEDSDIKLPKYPAICLEFRGSRSEQKTIGKDRATFVRTVFVDVLYYHAEINSGFKNMELVLGGGRLTSIIQRNLDINGYCRLGIQMDGGTVVDKVKGNVILKAYRIPVRIPVVYRDRAAGPST